MATLKATGLGEVLWDVFPDGRALGGAPTNFAWHAGQLGADAHVVSAVGRDDDGDQLLARLRDMGIETGTVSRLEDYPTSTVTVELDAAGVPRYVIHEPVAWDRLPDTPAARAAVADADAVAFGSLAQRSAEARKTLRALVEATSPSALRVFDINLRQAYYDAETVGWGLSVAGGFKLNDEELPKTAALLDLPAGEDAFAAEAFRRYAGLRWIVLTRGEHGATLWTPGPDRQTPQRHDAPTPKTRVVDTVGAGDALTATLSVGWLRGIEPGKLLALSVRAAAMVCAHAGATPVWPEALRDAVLKG